MAGANLGTAWIQIKPSMKGMTSSLKKEFSGASNAVAGEGSKLSSAFSQMGAQAGESLKTGLMVGAAAAVAGAVALVKDAISKFAEFEQLSGGIQKIFNEMDYNTIAKDAQAAYKTMNISANEYMKQISGVGATFAQTMGDQKGYNTAKRGMQSLADYASGTGKDVGLLMEKYQQITRSASGYLSIADQFAGILPQTTKDFLTQAQSAGFLSDKYTSLTQVPIAEYQQAITQMIEKGVDDMGLLGNTADETENTISGSVNGMKASWENFIVSLGDDTQDSGEKFKEFTDIASTAIGNILPKVTNVLTTVWNMLGQISPFLQPILIFLSTVVGIFAAQKVFTGLLGIFSLIMNNPIAFAIGAIVTAIYLLITHWDELSAAVGGVIENISNAIGGFAEWVGGVFQGIWDTVTGIFSKIGEFFKGVWDKITKIFTGIGTFIGEAVSGGFKAVVNGILGFVENFINTPINILNGFLDIINGAFGWLGVNLTHIEGVNLPRLASGGLVRGVGTDTSDSNLYALSKGEYVIRAAAARDIGYDNLRRMNETGEISNNQMVNITINGYNKSPEELATIISRKIAFNQRGVIG